MLRPWKGGEGILTRHWPTLNHNPTRVSGLRLRARPNLSLPSHFHPRISRKMSTCTTSSQTLVAVVGVGLVGSEFVNQLLALPANLAKSFKIISLSTSKITYFDGNGLQLSGESGWKSSLADLPRLDLPKAIDQLKSLVKNNNRVVLVDNTSDVGIAGLYADLISNGISVITPNKKAYSGSLTEYKKIRAAIEGSANGARVMDESTVGAGLPIISTLKTLLATGDEVSFVDQSPITSYLIILRNRLQK